MAIMYDDNKFIDINHNNSNANTVIIKKAV